MVADVNLVDNFFPSIRSLYRDIDILAELTGLYRVEKYSTNVSITEEDGILYFKTDFGITRAIYPKDSSNFSSLDGSMNIKFNMDNSGFCRSIDFNLFGSVLNAKKIE